MSAMGDAMIDRTEALMRARGLEYSPEVWDALTAELLDPPRYVLALSGTAGPASWHMADRDTIVEGGWAFAACSSRVVVSVEHEGSEPATATAENVSCLRCSRRLERAGHAAAAAKLLAR